MAQVHHCPARAASRVRAISRWPDRAMAALWSRQSQTRRLLPLLKEIGDGRCGGHGPFAMMVCGFDLALLVACLIVEFSSSPPGPSVT